MKLIDLTGEKIGKLTVLKRAEDLISDSGRKYVKWTCKCECGTIKDILSSNLRKRGYQSCGCVRNKKSTERLEKIPRIKFDKGQASFNILFNRYKRDAEKRGLYFDLNEKEFRILTSSDCYYCGTSPSQSIQGKRTNGEYIYNGIDREDNSMGYEYWNCVSCCRTCNFAKKDLNQDDFFKWIKRLIEHRKDNIDYFL